MSKKGILALVCIFALCAMLFGCQGNGADTTAETTTTAAETTAAAAEGTFVPGTYNAEQEGNGGVVKVAVTFSETEITDIEIVEQTETAGLGDAALEKLVEEVLNGQSLAVDSISGATHSSEALLAAIADCVAQAGGDVEALKEKEITKTSKDPIEKTADIVIIGGGGAGLASAVSAAENGASVILIEKSIALGGNTLRSGGGYNTYDPVRQSTYPMNEALMRELTGYLEDDPSEYGDFAPTMEALQAEIQDYIDNGDTEHLFDSPNLHAIQTYLGGKRTDLNGVEITGNYELVTTFTQNTLPTLEWLESEGVGIKDSVSTILGALWPRSHGGTEHLGSSFLDPLENRADALGVEIMLETKGDSLIVEDGRVVGVKATQTDGTPVTLMANNGVIMATGGFGANPEMRQEYNTYWPAMPLTMMTTNTPDATGDGIVMGKEIGANLVGMGFIQLMPSSDPLNGSLAGGVWGSAEDQVFVNSDGKRFVNEYSERDVLAKAALEQENELFYIICDKNTAGIPENGITGWGDDVTKLIEDKRVFKADTLEDLALQLGMEEDALVTEIEKYNTYIDEQYDPEFGKTNFGTKIETAPFYATPRSPSVHHTMGGLAIDTQCHVLNENGEIIPGFYAAGEVTGGIHAGNRLGGNAIADIMTMGKIAGETAATEK